MESIQNNNNKRYYDFSPLVQENRQKITDQETENQEKIIEQQKKCYRKFLKITIVN
jgi:hypothetical protein